MRIGGGLVYEAPIFKRTCVFCGSILRLASSFFFKDEIGLLCLFS